MQEFLNIILSMPTVVFTILMGVTVLYWVTVIMGAVDVDLFDLDIELEADADFDVDVDADLDADVDMDGDFDVESSAGAFATLLMALGLVGVPLTISMSFLVIYNWSFTFLFSYFLGAGTDPIGTMWGVGMLGTSFVLSLLMTSLTVRPLRSIFQSKQAAHSGDALMGKTVKVLSGSVTSRSGRAETTLEGSVLNLSIRCYADNDLSRGDEALVIGYDDDAHVYEVEPLDVMLGETRTKPSSDEELHAEFDTLAESEKEREVPAHATSTKKS